MSIVDSELNRNESHTNSSTEIPVGFMHWTSLSPTDPVYDPTDVRQRIGTQTRTFGCSWDPSVSGTPKIDRGKREWEAYSLNPWRLVEFYKSSEMKLFGKNHDRYYPRKVTLHVFKLNWYQFVLGLSISSITTLVYADLRENPTFKQRRDTVNIEGFRSLFTTSTHAVSSRTPFRPSPTCFVSTRQSNQLYLLRTPWVTDTTHFLSFLFPYGTPFLLYFDGENPHRPFGISSGQVIFMF